MGLGDEILASGHAQRVYDADPSRRVAICDRIDRVRWHELWEGNPIIAKPENVSRGERVHRIRNGVECRPYLQSISVTQGLRFSDTWRAADHVGRLYLTNDEQQLGKSLRSEIGPFVVIEPGAKPGSCPNKHWGWNRWQAVVKASPDVRFLQMPHEGATPLDGVNAVSVAGFRRVCGVLAAADAYVGPEGGLHHAGAVLGLPAVVIFGGFISPRVTGYPWHVNIADTSPGSPCGRWRPCEHCCEAMERITVDRVVQTVRSLSLRERCA